MKARSASLWGDAVDFLSDGLNDGVSLAMPGAAAAIRSKTALFNAACPLAFGIGIFDTGAPWPDWFVVGIIGALAISSGVAAWRRASAELKADTGH